MQNILDRMMEAILEENFAGCNAAYEIRDFFQIDLREKMGTDYDARIASTLEEIVVQQWKNNNPNILH